MLQSNKFLEFDLSNAIENIPLNWNLNKISDFLQHNLSKLNYTRRFFSIKKSLCYYQNLRIREEAMNLKNKKILLNEHRYAINIYFSIYLN